MNSKAKGIIVCAVVVACLGGTLGILELTGADTGDSSSAVTTSASTSSEKDESVKLVDKQAADVAELTAVNENGSFTYYRDTETGKETTGIRELEGIELNTSMVSDLASDASQLKAYKLVESDSQDLAKYGFETPYATFTVKFTDGTERTFVVGDSAPQNRYRYLHEDGSNDVYMILESTVKYYAERKEAFAATTLLTKPSDDDMPAFGTLTIERSDIDYKMVFRQDSEEVNEKMSENMASQQVMTEPIFSYLNVDTATDTLYGLYGLTAQEAEVVFPDKAAMKKYGLDKPRATVTYTGDGYDYKLTIGDEYHEVNDDGEEQSAVSAYYCYFTGVDGKDAIWKIDASALPWVTLEPGDIVSSMMTWNMVVDVDNIKMEGELDTQFDLTSESPDGDDSSADLTKAECDGKEVSVDTFKSFYMYVLTCPTSEIIFDLPDGKPYQSIEINCADGTSDRIDFYKDTERRSIAVLNGKTPYRIASSWVTRLISNAKAVKDGGEVSNTY